MASEIKREFAPLPRVHPWLMYWQWGSSGVNKICAIIGHSPLNKVACSICYPPLAHQTETAIHDCFCQNEQFDQNFKNESVHPLGNFVFFPNMIAVEQSVFLQISFLSSWSLNSWSWDSGHYSFSAKPPILALFCFERSDYLERTFSSCSSTIIRTCTKGF